MTDQSDALHQHLQLQLVIQPQTPKHYRHHYHSRHGSGNWEMVPSSILESIIAMQDDLTLLLNCMLVCKKWYFALNDERSEIWRIMATRKLSKSVVKSNVLSSLSGYKGKLRACKIKSCQQGNRFMGACLHTYLERDFSIVEELLKRPPYGENGHILIEENEFDSMCQQLLSMKDCYEQSMSTCISYVQYSHMKRIIRSLRFTYNSFCSNETFNVKNLIEGGYCLEYVRLKKSPCSLPKSELYRLPLNYTYDFDMNQIQSVEPKHRWPYTINGMLRFEIGRDICPYLQEFNSCMRPFIHEHCRESSHIIWNHTMTNILNIWCTNSTSSSWTSLWIIMLIIHVIILIKS
ncbi:hypothetical protein RDWZM_000259 [Blomia tropicalis]|uniref:F-box domain-containing protein n=1 Tax=Blomia tropicalis TaxID=40697 RepID=A0A9Q0MA14_BLOTA|nr:hypothetical protein RDWZM_000259 [Blomia tropicalis]